jgi:hypothetical protein
MVALAGTVDGRGYGKRLLPAVTASWMPPRLGVHARVMVVCE